ncbi:MAG: VTT domain-containing protein [Parvibaculaceae bacterium]|nr:VTT domain-containing protein [Parvibaculaceae bacterium]
MPPRGNQAPAAENAEPGSILRPGHNVWRVEQADRASLLVDAAAYFGALRQAMLAAERSIAIVGWDIDSRTKLVGPSGKADDGFPECFGEFLTALAKRRPSLKIYLLLWDYSVIYAMEREALPAIPLRWTTPSNIDLCLDDDVPLGASQHQKIAVIDGRLAFSGGLDITIRRWDTCEHDPDNAQRLDPADKPYRPFHDVQLMVDGAAAGALCDLVTDRWENAACENIDLSPGRNDPWPAEVEPDVTSVRVGIARTIAPSSGGPDCREVERLFLDMARQAERWIYIENQFLTCTGFAHEVAKRMQEKPELELLLVAPMTHDTWLEHQTMLAGRIRFMGILREAGVVSRTRLVYPWVKGEGDETDVMVHSKVMIVDDRFLRVGSANLANRSMGTDTECDLVIEAADQEDRTAVAGALATLLGEHCGASREEMAALIDTKASLFAAMDACASERRGLRPVEDDEVPYRKELAAIETVADPGRPITAGEHLADIVASPQDRKGLSALAKAAILVLAIVGIGLLWKYTPLSDYADPDMLRETFTGIAASPFAGLIVLAAYVVGGFIAFPLTALIVVTAGTFGLWPGLLYAGVGSMSSALATYGAGRSLGRKALRNIVGPRMNRIGKGIGKSGVPAIAAIRLVPIAPFTLVNLVAGALRIPVLDYALGTMLGLAPGIVVLSVMGDRVFALLANPSLLDLALVIVAFLCWIGLAFGLQRLITKWRQSD